MGRLKRPSTEEVPTIQEDGDGGNGAEDKEDDDKDDVKSIPCDD